jgi:hemin uptake protein HemP
MSKTNSAASIPAPAGKAPMTPRRISSDMLLGPIGELVIVHGSREYRLRITQNGKLILTA